MQKSRVMHLRMPLVEGSRLKLQKTLQLVDSAVPVSARKYPSRHQNYNDPAQ